MCSDHDPSPFHGPLRVPLHRWSNEPGAEMEAAGTELQRLLRTAPVTLQSVDITFDYEDLEDAEVGDARIASLSPDDIARIVADLPVFQHLAFVVLRPDGPAAVPGGQALPPWWHVVALNIDWDEALLRQRFPMIHIDMLVDPTF